MTPHGIVIFCAALMFTSILGACSSRAEEEDSGSASSEVKGASHDDEDEDYDYQRQEEEQRALTRERQSHERPEYTPEPSNRICEPGERIPCRCVVFESRG